MISFLTIESLVWLAKLGLSLATLVAILLYWFQENLLFLPNIDGYKRPETNPPTLRHPGEQGLQYENHYIKTGDGETIQLWLILQAASVSSPTIIFFHGNAGNMGLRLQLMAKLYREVQCNILMVSYRGYGNSTGKPTEAGVNLDAQAALLFLHNKCDTKIDTSRIFAYGKSLGGAVSVRLCANHPDLVAGLILENTYTSIPTLVDTLFPYLSTFKWLILRLNHNSLELVKTGAFENLKMLVINGEKDELVPPIHSKLLFQASTSKRKRLLLCQTGNHNETFMALGSHYQTELHNFMWTKEWPGNLGLCGSVAANRSISKLLLD